MNKVLILSDSHGLKKEIQKIIQRHQANEVIHCGDSELEYNAEELSNMIKVGGNCDYDPKFPDDQIKEIDNLKIFVTHGHLYGVKMNLTRLAYRAEEEGAQVICFGHSHIAGAEKIGNQLFINPGSIRMPRKRIEPTYAILEWKTLHHINVKFYTVEGEYVKDLSCEVSLES